MNFYDEAIEAKHQLQLDLVRRRRELVQLVKNHKSVEKVTTPELVRGVIYDHDIATLEDADPYFWDPRVTQMVLATGQQLPETIRFDVSWLRGKAGYWWFGRSSPLIGMGSAGERKYVNALLWSVAPNGTVSVETLHITGREQHPLGSLSWEEGESLTDAMSRAGTLERDLMRAPSLVLRQIALGLSGDLLRLSGEITSLTKEAIEKHHEVDRQAEQEGIEIDPYRLNKWEARLRSDLAQEQDEKRRIEQASEEYQQRLREWIAASRNALQVFACGCLWLQQKIVTASQAPLARAAQRRLAREGIDPKCLVVELRSKQYTRTSPEDEARQVDWAWQWAVRGHWRDQPTKEGTKLIWIHPYIKGPEDKPLKPDAGRVFAVTR